MNTFKKIGVGILSAMALLGTVTSCQDYDNPVIDAPIATSQANISIYDLKQTFWEDETNYIWGTEQKESATPVAIPAREDGSHYIIKGTVISSDEAGNVFKSLVIQDETAALAISINSYNLYLNYRRGQEVVLDVTGMYMGKYNGLLQLGAPEWYANGNAWEASFMAPETFKNHVELNGWPNIAEIDTLQVNTFSELGTSPDQLMYWQSQLVRFNNVSFVNGGVETFATYHSSGDNQSIMDSEGNSMIVRTSGYSNFWNQTLPEGNLDLVCIASYYGTTGWQLILIDAEGCMNVGNPTSTPGAESNPWTVDQAIAEVNAGRTPNGWVTGYIVGTVAPEVTSVTSNSDVEWTSTPILGNTFVIGQTPDTKDIANALVMEIPANSKLYSLGNLVDNPGNYQKQIWIKGTMSKYMDTYGILGNNGTAGTWRIDGVEDNTVIADGDGSKTSPYSANQVIAMAKTDATAAWVTGYIVGSVPSGGLAASEFVPGAAGASTTNIFIANNPDETDYLKCVPVQLPSGAVRTALNLSANPGLYQAKVSIYGTLEKYFGVSGLKNASDYTIDSEGTGGDNPGGGGNDNPSTGGEGTETSPYTCADVMAMNPQSTTAPVKSGVWTKGYIVGWADMSSTYYINAETSRFSVPATLATNILLSDSPTATSYTQCIGVQLPSGAVRSALNLQNNPDNLGKQVMIKGDIALYSGVAGIRSASDYKLDGQSSGGGGGNDTPTTPGTPGEDGVYSVAAALSCINSGSIPSGEVKVRGIISSITEISTSYGNATYIIKDQLSDSNGLTIYRGYYLDGAKFTSEDQIAVGGTVVVEGTLVLYGGSTPEVSTGNKIVSYTAPGETPGGGGNDNPTTPPTPSGDYKGDFNSFNGGTPKSSYGTYTNATGWTATNSAILSGTNDDTANNPYFTFIGGSGVLAPTLNGKAGTAGTLTSPTLAGGIGTLTFNYGFAFAETACSFTINVKDTSGNIVKTDTVDLSSIQQKYAYSYSLEVNYTGSFVIEIVNNAKTQSSSNKDRVSIWNLTWTN